MPKYHKSYEELEEFLIQKINEIPHGTLKDWCEKHESSAAEVSRFRNRNLKTTRPFFLKDMLEAFGYAKVKVKTITTFEFTD